MTVVTVIFIALSSQDPEDGISGGHVVNNNSINILSRIYLVFI